MSRLCGPPLHVEVCNSPAAGDVVSNSWKPLPRVPGWKEPPHQVLALKYPHSMQALKSLSLEPTGDHSAGPSQLQLASRDQMRPLMSLHCSPATPLDQPCSLLSSMSCSEKLIPQLTSFMLISTSEPASQRASSKTEFKVQGYLFAIPSPVFQVSCNTWLHGFVWV